MRTENTVTLSFEVPLHLACDVLAAVTQTLEGASPTQALPTPAPKAEKAPAPAKKEEPAPADKAEKPSEEVVTVDDLKRHAAAVIDLHGPATLRSTLDGFGASKVATVPEEDRPAFLAALQELLS